jgi:hypothetical protein
MSTFNISDQELLNQMQYHLIESPNSGASIGSDLWTTTEWIQYLNDRQRLFLKETGIVVTYTTMSGVIGQQSYELPEGSCGLRRLAWEGSSTYRSMHRVDTWMLDNVCSTWPTATSAIPKYYNEVNLPTQTFEVAGIPSAAGTFHILYLSTEAALSNTGVRLSVPDEFAHYIMWGAIADCLKKTGPMYDPIRAKYAEERFVEGVQLAKLAVSQVEGTNG